MKICVLSSNSFEQNYASYHLIRDLLLYLVDAGHEVTLIQKRFKAKAILPEELKGRIEVDEIPFRKQRKNSFARRFLADARYYWKARRYIEQEKDCDAFFLQSNNVPYIPIFLINRLAHKPIVYNVQDIFPQNAFAAGMLKENSFLGRLFCRLQRWSLKHANGIVTISEDMKDTLVQAGADKNKVIVAYNWENEIHVEPTLKQQDNKIHVVYAGNIGVMQNVEMVVRTAQILQKEDKIQFDIYGAGARKKNCLEMAAGLSNVAFYDPVPSEQAYSLYYNADLNVIPLVKGGVKTALPSKSATCVKCGKPFIFCVENDSRWSKQLNDADCIVVDPTNPKALAVAIISIISEKSKNQNEQLKNLFNKECSLRKYENAIVNTGKNVML